MKLYIVRIPGYRLTVSASSSWDAITQVQREFIAPRISARPA
jgi:hypothetical protein